MVGGRGSWVIGVTDISGTINDWPNDHGVGVEETAAPVNEVGIPTTKVDWSPVRAAARAISPHPIRIRVTAIPMTKVAPNTV